MNRSKNSKNMSRITGNKSETEYENEDNEKNKGKYNDLKKALYEGRKKLVLDNAEEAHDLILSAIKDSINKDGDKKEIENYNNLYEPAYYLLGECCIKMEKVKKAKDFLMTGFGNSVKKKIDVDGNNNSSINEENKMDNGNENFNEFAIFKHRAFAKFFEYNKSYDKAIEEISNAILIDSFKYGPESLMMCNLYYQIGYLFLNIKKKNSESSRYFKKIISIWFEELKSNLKENPDKPLTRLKLLEEENIEILEAKMILHHLKKEVNKKSLFPDKKEQAKLKMIIYLCQISIESQENSERDLLYDEFNNNAQIYYDNNKEEIQKLEEIINKYIND